MIEVRCNPDVIRIMAQRRKIVSPGLNARGLYRNAVSPGLTRGARHKRVRFLAWRAGRSDDRVSVRVLHNASLSAKCMACPSRSAISGRRAACRSAPYRREVERLMAAGIHGEAQSLPDSEWRCGPTQTALSSTPLADQACCAFVPSSYSKPKVRRGVAMLSSASFGSHFDFVNWAPTRVCSN